MRASPHEGELERPWATRKRAVVMGSGIRPAPSKRVVGRRHSGWLCLDPPPRVGGAQFNDTGGHAGNSDAVAWREPRLLQPAPQEADLGLEETFPRVPLRLDLQGANGREWRDPRW